MLTFDWTINVSDLVLSCVMPWRRVCWRSLVLLGVLMAWTLFDLWT